MEPEGSPKQTKKNLHTPLKIKGLDARNRDISMIQENVAVSKNKGTPKWMVYNVKPYQNGWFGGTTIFGNIRMC